MAGPKFIKQRGIFMKLRSLTLEDMEKVRQWRNNNLEALRTPYVLTKEMQEEFYKKVIISRDAKVRLWAIDVGDELIGMGGLMNIEWENRLAEISILIDPKKWKMGYGSEAVHLILLEGFNNINVENIYGECYLCSPSVEFWKKISLKYNAYTTRLPKRKYWKGNYWDSLYFNISKNPVFAEDTSGTNGVQS